MKSMFVHPASEYLAIAVSLFAVVSFLTIWFTR